MWRGCWVGNSSWNGFRPPSGAGVLSTVDVLSLVLGGASQEGSSPPAAKTKLS